MLEPNSQGADRVLIRISKAVNSTATLDDSCCLVVLVRLLIARDGLCKHLVIINFADDSTRVADIDAEQFLAKSHDGDASGARETNVHGTVVQLVIAVEEGVVERDADFVSVQHFVSLLLDELLVVLAEHVAQLGLAELGQALLHVGGDFTTVLAVTISDREEVTVLEATEVRHCDPSILVRFVRVRWSHACLCRKSELSDTVGEHLFGVGSVVRMGLIESLTLGLWVLHFDLLLRLLDLSLVLGLLLLLG